MEPELPSHHRSASIRRSNTSKSHQASIVRNVIAMLSALLLISQAGLLAQGSRENGNGLVSNQLQQPPQKAVHLLISLQDRGGILPLFVALGSYSEQFGLHVPPI